jgi:selenocysteine lyase/cysteine desulfurase
MNRKKFLAFGGSLFAAYHAQKLKAMPVNLVENLDLGTESWELLRTQFPLKSDLTFLNNGTMGITPNAVLKALNDSYIQVAENAAYPHHDNALEKKLAAIVGADSDELCMTKNVSEGINHICWGLKLKKGDEIIMTTHEHVGGCAPWLHRAKLEGLVIKTFPLGKTAEETIENFKKAITKKTKVMAVPHIPCTIGQVLPVKELCEISRKNAIISCIDGAHPLGMIQFNLHDMGCDYYAGCFHKWLLGPIGNGWMYIRKDLLSTTKITHVAAYSLNEFNMSAQPPMLSDPINQASRYSYGTFNGPGLIGCQAALDFYTNIGPQKIENRVKELSKDLQNKIIDIKPQNGVLLEMLTPEEDRSRGAQVGFKITSAKKDKTSGGFVNYARSKKIILRHVPENGIDCVRVSTHYYNSMEDIDLCVKTLRDYIYEA